jgi:hypothetical protein
LKLKREKWTEQMGRGQNTRNGFKISARIPLAKYREVKHSGAGVLNQNVLLAISAEATERNAS